MSNSASTGLARKCIPRRRISVVFHVVDRPNARYRPFPRIKEPRKRFLVGINVIPSPKIDGAILTGGSPSFGRPVFARPDPSNWARLRVKKGSPIPPRRRAKGYRSCRYLSRAGPSWEAPAIKRPEEVFLERKCRENYDSRQIESIERLRVVS